MVEGADTAAVKFPNKFEVAAMLVDAWLVTTFGCPKTGTDGPADVAVASIEVFPNWNTGPDAAVVAVVVVVDGFEPN